MLNDLRMKSNLKFGQDQPGDCLPKEFPYTGWTEYIESNLSKTRNRTIEFDCQKEFTSNRRVCLASETRTAVAKNKKAEIYLDEDSKIVGGNNFFYRIKMDNTEWEMKLSCSGKRERLNSLHKNSLVVVGESIMREVEAVMDKIDSLTREMSMVPNAVFLPTKAEQDRIIAGRHPLSPPLV